MPNVYSIVLIVLIINGFVIVADAEYKFTSAGNYWANNQIISTFISPTNNNQNQYSYTIASGSKSSQSNLPSNASFSTASAGTGIGGGSSFNFIDVIRLLSDILILLIGLLGYIVIFWYMLPIYSSMQFILTLVTVITYSFAMYKALIGRIEI